MALNRDEATPQHSGADALANRERRPALAHLGLGFHWAWTFLCFYSPTLFPPIGASVPKIHTFLLVSISANALALILTAVAGARLNHSQRTALLIASCLAAVIGTALAALGGGTAPYHSVLLVSGAVLTGIGTAFILIGWGELYGSLGAGRASITTAASAVLAVATYFIVIFLPPFAGLSPAWGIACTALLPALSGALVWVSIRNTPVVEHPPLPRSATRGFPLPWRLAVGVGAYGVVFGLMRGITDLSAGGETFVPVGRFAVLGGGIVALLIAVGALTSRRDLDFGFTYRPIMPLMVAGLLMLPFFGLGNATFARAIIGTSYSYLDILVWIVLSDLTFRIAKPATLVFGWGRGVMTLSVFAGWIVGFLIANEMTVSATLLSALSLLSVFVLVVSAVMILNERDVFGLWGSPEASAAVADNEKRPGQWRQRCLAIAETYGLSPREEEVLLLLAKGRSLPFIRDELGIAGGTVQAHITHIYRKLNIHTRQQLIDLIESRPEAEPRQ